MRLRRERAFVWRRAAQLAAVTAATMLAGAGGAGASTGSMMTVDGSGFSPDSAVVVAECSQQALTAALASFSSALDYCDAHFVAVTSSGAHGSFTVRARALAQIETTSGPVDCRKVACLLGALNLDALQGKPPQVAVLPLHFSSAARSARVARRRVPMRSVAGAVTPGRPLVLGATAFPAGSLGMGRIGTVVQVPARPLPRRRLTGEGLLALTMRAPGTSWSSGRNTSVVVQARVDRGPWQAIVLFAGARPFTYEGFTGPLRTGRHSVQVRVSQSLSHVSGRAPAVRVSAESLRVLDPRSLEGVELAHAPVLYDRLAGTAGDTPLLTYATDQRLAGGARRLTYVVVFSHEDAGTGFIPWLEWGTWGRMTDIETAISFDVGRTGAVSNATYLTCSACGPGFPDTRTALNEVERPFEGHWFHRHPVLRVSTGNNDFSDQGVTPLRLQQALAAPPRRGDTREGAMDRNPWTYGVMGQEVRRERADYSTDPASAAPGDPRQYLTLQLSTTVRDAAAVGVDIRLAGSTQTYSNDLGTTYPLYDGGEARTVVKVPLALVGHRITMLRLRLLPASNTTPSLAIHSLEVLQYTGGRIVRRAFPTPRVIVEATPPPGLGAPTLLPAGG